MLSHGSHTAPLGHGCWMIPQESLKGQNLCCSLSLSHAVLSPHWGGPSFASGPAPHGFQPPSNVCLALWNLPEQLLALKAHLYVKLNRYRPLIYTLDWEKSGQKWKKKIKKNKRNRKEYRWLELQLQLHSLYATCRAHLFQHPNKAGMGSFTLRPKLEEVFALLWISRNSQTQMMHKLGASQTPSCSNIFLWSNWHPCKVWRGAHRSALLLSSWRNVKLNLSMLSPHSFLLAPWHVRYN